MSAIALSPEAVAKPATHGVFRDDGPLARAIGQAVGRRLPVPPFALAALGALPLFVAIAVAGDGASDALAGVVVAWFVLLAGCSTGRLDHSRWRWTGTPFVRAGEYAGLIWIGSLAGASSVPAVFALLAVVAYRHYDLVYRLRIRREVPPPWVGIAAGGWDGRLVLAYVLLVTGALPAGLYVAAGLLAVVLIGETVASWRAFLGRQGSGDVISYEDEEDEGQ